MLGRLALLFIAVPLLELALLIQVGRWTGIWTTVGLVFLTGILGAALARAEGLRTLWSFRADVARGRIPGQALQDGLAILVGGALLLTPGFVTDVVGFALLFPPTRRALQAAVRRRLRRAMEEGSVRVVTPFGPFGPGSPGHDAGGAAPAGETREGEAARDTPPELDPDKEIVR